jgi:tetratricopeptide (TPR) repeat protein
MDFQKTDKDIALLKLTKNVTGVKPIQLYRGGDEKGKKITAYGKGATGNGLIGAQLETAGTGVMNKFTNIISKVTDKWLFYRFDKSPEALPLEGMTGSGDSGGPAIIIENDTPYLVGLHSWHTYEGDMSNYQPALYGQSGVLVRVSGYQDWIKSVINSENDALDDYILTQMSESNVQGMQLAIIQDEKVIKVADYGVVKDVDNMPLNALEIADWIIRLQKDHFFEQVTNTNTRLKCPVINKNTTSHTISGCVIDWTKSERTDHPVIKGNDNKQLSISIYPKGSLFIVLLSQNVSYIPENFSDDIAYFYLPTMKEYSGYGLVTSVKNLWRDLEITGYENAHSVAIKLQNIHNFKFEESNLDNWGYLLLDQNKSKQAAQVFKLNNRFFPNSANTFYDLGEAYSELKLSQQAIESYEKSVALNPGYEPYVREKIEALKEKN